MSPILSIEGAVVEESQIGFVDQSGALQCVSGTLALEMVPRDVAQFFVDKWNQRFQRVWVASFPACKQFGNSMGMLLIHSRLQPQVR
jgi:hypothetical protein